MNSCPFVGKTVGMGLVVQYPCPECDMDFLLAGNGKEGEPITRCPSCLSQSQIPPDVWVSMLEGIVQLAEQDISYWKTRQT